MTQTGDFAEYVDAALRQRIEFIESDVAEAMTLQEFGMLDRLVIVYGPRPEGGPAVASMLTAGEMAAPMPEQLCKTCGSSPPDIEGYCSACWERGWREAIRREENNLRTARANVKYHVQALKDAKKQVERAYIKAPAIGGKGSS